LACFIARLFDVDVVEGPKRAPVSPTLVGALWAGGLTFAIAPMVALRFHG